MDSLIDRRPARATKPAHDKAAFPSSQELPKAAIRRVGVVGLGDTAPASRRKL